MKIFFDTNESIHIVSMGQYLRILEEHGFLE